jgi:hypothetical protein
MWFWGRKKNSAADAWQDWADAPGPNRLDELADRLQREGRTDQLERELETYRPNELDGSERESWYHLHGIAAFRRGDHELAFQRFREGLEQCPDSGALLFSLGQEHERRGESERMFACFDRALFPKVSGAHALAEARYAYLWNRNDRGWEYVAALIPAYVKLGVLDDTFLWTRGFPFFGPVWDYLAAFATLERNFDRLRDVTKDVSKHCSDFDFRELRKRIDGFETGNRSALKARLQSAVAEYHSRGFPSGYQALQLNVILAQEASSEGEAVSLLESVKFGDKDFKWLADMRVLALAERAHAFGNTQREHEIRTDFLGRQPLLFEPDHALNFEQLVYQETLKPLYRESRQHRT